jgi:hypothetical protein
MISADQIAAFKIECLTGEKEKQKLKIKQKIERKI